MTTGLFRAARWAAACGMFAVAVAACGDSSDPSDDTGAPDDTADTAEDDAGDTAEPDTQADTAGPDTTEDTADPPLDTAESDTSVDDVSDTSEPPADTVMVDTAEARCGDGQMDFGEDCDDGDANNSDTAADACRTDCTLARCGDMVTDSGETCDDGNSNDFDGCTSTCESGPVIAVPGAGDVVISELMINPDLASEPAGEWIEIVNLSGERLNLGGCDLVDDGTDSFTFTGPGGGYFLDPGARLVLGTETDPDLNGGLVPDYIYGGMLLDNVADEVRLTCAGVTVDEVAWTASWALVSGRTLSLDPSREDTANNDDVASWCGAATTYGAGDRGTPGLPNASCPSLDAIVDDCTLVPATTTVFDGVPFDVSVEVFEAGVTDFTNGTDPSPNLRAEIGVGAVGTAPSSDPSWVWQSTGPTPLWSAVDGTDSYTGTATLTMLGASAVGARVSRDGGATWLYCDLTGGSDGFDVADLDTTTVVANPCDGVACTSPQGASCGIDGLQRISYAAVGTCVPLGVTQTACDYPPTSVNCGDTGQVCAAGACAGLAPQPAAGEIVFSELMLRPAAGEAQEGQWLELSVLSATPVNLEGCTLTIEEPSAVDGDPPTVTSHTVGMPFVVAGASVAVAGASADAGVNGDTPVDYAWGADLTFPASTFSIALGCGGSVIDELTYVAGEWPTTVGGSLSLSPFRTDVAANDDAANWCLTQASFGAGDRGTPGVENPQCPGDIVAVQACWIESPDPTDTSNAGTPYEVTLRFIAPQVTGLTIRTNPSPKIVVEAGYGPVGSTPDASWTWAVADPDLVFAATTAGVDSATDQYKAGLVQPGPGMVDIAMRVTADGGNSSYICDRDSNVPTYDPSTTLTVTVAASACFPDPCGPVPGLSCEPAAGGGLSTQVVDLSGPSSCTLDAMGASVCEWPSEDIEDCAPLGAECQAGACANFPAVPTVGAAIFTEIMIVPSNADGEWVELHNPGTTPLDLEGCTLESGPSESVTLEFSSFLTGVLAPGESLVVARSGSSFINGGVQPSLVYSGLAFNNNADWLQLVCDGVVIDTFAYDVEDDWPVTPQKPLSLAGNRYSSTDNDFDQYWCVVGAHSANSVNPLCPAPDAIIDDCRVVLPGPLTAEVDSTVSYMGRLLDLEVTDIQPGLDVSPNTIAEVGFGPVGTSPSASWTWTDAQPDADWTDDAVAPGYDQWVGDLTVDTPGTVSVSFRFSADDGASWTYCDADGVANGVSAAQTAALTLTPTLCNPNPCTAPAAPECLGNNIKVERAPGTCSEDPMTGAAACTYPSVLFSCSPYGGCDMGDCVTPPISPAAAGDLVISEIMADSVAAAPDLGEWFELYNPTTEPLDLNGCVVTGGAGESFTITSDLYVVLPAGQYFLIAASSAGISAGGPSGVDFVWDNFAFDNASDTVTISCGGVMIDTVTYDWDWPDTAGSSMQVDNQSLDAATNDDKATWCIGNTAFVGGNKGTPGTPNKVCP